VEDHVKDEQNLHIMGILKKAGSGHRPSGIEENCFERE
jgi:hypothetical protein